jgi:hypothetical protein
LSAAGVISHFSAVAFSSSFIDLMHDGLDEEREKDFSLKKWL